jgi:tagatose-1,6-bisphosphate aldolase
MSKNYAYESGVFQALAQMQRDAINKLAAADNDADRVWATRDLILLSKQTTEALVKYGYEQKEVDTV